MKPPSFLSSLRALARRSCGAALMIAGAIALTSCSLSRPAILKNSFLLQPELPAPVAAKQPSTLRVGVINVAEPFRSKSLVYRTGELKYESDFYNEFFVAPTAMFSDSAAKALAAANVFRRVVSPGAAAADDGDFVLDGFASDFYSDLRDSGKPSAVLSITFYLSTTSTVVPNVVWSHQYRQRTAATNATPEALALAMNGALTTMLAELVRDLSVAKLPPT